MEIILLIVAFAIIFLIMVVKQNDFVSPSFMFAAPLIVSIFICVIYQNKWNFECRLETFLLIIVGIVLFFCGDQIGNKMSRRKIGYNEKLKAK